LKKNNRSTFNIAKTTKIKSEKNNPKKDIKTSISIDTTVSKKKKKRGELSFRVGQH
jgi:hypothetical protein